MSQQAEQMKTNPVTDFLNPETTLTGHGFRRRPLVAGHDRAASTKLLGDPKGRLSRGIRKSLLYFRSYVWVPLRPQEAVPAPVKMARKLTTLRLTQLVRQQKKFAREASTVKHILAKMSPGYSRLRSQMEARQNVCLSNFKQVCAEINARALACQGKLSEAV